MLMSANVKNKLSANAFGTYNPKYRLEKLFDVVGSTVENNVEVLLRSVIPYTIGAYGKIGEITSMIERVILGTIIINVSGTRVISNVAGIFGIGINFAEASIYPTIIFFPSSDR